MSASLFKRVDYIQHAVTYSGAEIVGVNAGLIAFLDCLDVSERKVYDVNVIAHARSVGSGIVVAEHAYFLALATRYLSDVGGKVVGYAPWGLRR